MLAVNYQAIICPAIHPQLHSLAGYWTRLDIRWCRRCRNLDCRFNPANYRPLYRL